MIGPLTWSLSTFQSTPPRRWRLVASRHEVNEVEISIHATTQVATNGALTVDAAITISIHATTQVAT